MAVGLTIVAALCILPWLIMVGLLSLATVALLSLDAARLRVPSFRHRCSVWLASFLRKEEERKLTGASYFLLGSLVTVLAFPPGIASLAILFLTLGDPAATIIGIWKGRVRFWNKSLEGDIACFAVCLLVAVLVVVVRGSPKLLAAIAGAFIATIFEALPLRLNDNLTIPFGSALAMLLVNMLT